MCQSRSASFSIYSHNLFKIILLQLSGVCPILPTAAECPPEPDNLCLTDAECPQMRNAVWSIVTWPVFVQVGSMLFSVCS